MICKATIKDIDAIMAIVCDAQEALRELGIDQWQDGYPTKSIIERDIDMGVGYIYKESCGIMGYAAIILNGEDAYHQIADEEWGTGDDYVVVHRICVKRGTTRKGVASVLMQKAKDLAIKAGYSGFRIDTHSGNVRMLTMLDKLGFTFRGIIQYESGKRLAYDLKFENSTML